jgi:hypothetical protein
MEDSDGEFCGDAQARKDVDSLCMDALLKQSEQAKLNAARKKTYAWELGNEEGKGNNSSLMSQILED